MFIGLIVVGMVEVMRFAGSTLPPPVLSHIKHWQTEREGGEGGRGEGGREEGKQQAVQTTPILPHVHVCTCT